MFYHLLLSSLTIVSVAATCSLEPQRQTDVCRKIRDSWVDWDEYVKAWQTLNSQGLDIISVIANSKLSARCVLCVNILTVTKVKLKKS